MRKVILNYNINVDILANNAANLTNSLKEIASDVYIICNNKKVNGKSLVGVLTGQIKENSKVKIIISNEDKIKEIRKIFNEYGKEF